jgi:hypothetical protein
MKRIIALIVCSLLALTPTAKAQVLGGGGNGSLVIGATVVQGGVTNDCLYVDGGSLLQQQACGGAGSIAIGSTITSSTAGYGLYVGTGGSAGLLEQFAYGANVFTALQSTLNGSGAISATTSPAFVTPAIGVATGTSLALGGATLGSNALAVTGSSALGATTASTLAIGGSTALTANAAASDVQAGTSGALVVTPTALMGSASPQTLAATGFAWNAAIGYNATATLTGNTQTIPNPTNIFAGQTYTLVINPSTFTGYAWGTAFDWGAAGAPTLTASKQNVIACISTATWTSTPTANGLLCTASLGF